MRNLLPLLALSAAACLGADLTGNWLVKQVSDDGNVRETYYDLKQEGSTVTGFTRSASFDRKIESGTLDASGNVTLTMPANGNPPPMKIEGKFVGDELHIAMRAPAGAGAMPEKIPHPALHKVPFNGLAKTPPMGWNSWNKFAGRVTADDVKGMADAIVSSGMMKAGYIYVNIDDTWEGMRA
jgi:alpha-galactosidase